MLEQERRILVEVAYQVEQAEHTSVAALELRKLKELQVILESMVDFIGPLE